VATYVLEGRGGTDLARARRAAAAAAPGFAALVELLTEATIEYLSMQIAAGAEAVQIFDSWAGALAAEEFRRWCLAPAAAIARALRARHPGVPVIGFPRGAGASHEDFAREAGVDAIALDQAVPLGWAARALQPHAALQGNLDPALLAVGGAPMEAAARRILTAWGGGSMVFNLGHGITPDVPVAHVERLSALLREGRLAEDAA
jgi:uroporphyrinogen decarboxylase